jgi:hypothetical protein
MELLVFWFFWIMMLVANCRVQKKEKFTIALKDFCLTEPTSLSDHDFAIYCMWLLNPGLFDKDYHYANDRLDDIQVIASLKQQPRTGIRCVNRKWVSEDDVYMCRRGCVNNKCGQAVIFTTGSVSLKAKESAEQLQVLIYQRPYMNQRLQELHTVMQRSGVEV